MQSKKANQKLIISIFGASGDLVSRKILPDISLFAKFNPNVQIRLNCFARKKLDKSNLEKLLGLNGTKNNNSIELNLFQTNYKYSELKNIIETEERVRHLIYLSLPPSAYSEILLNLSKLNLSYKTKILIEKPFALSLSSLIEDMKLIENSNLNNKILYFDHYRFKDTLKLLSEEYTVIKTLIANERINSIKLISYEKLGIESRVSYYEESGAVKDMFPHLYALLVELNNIGITDINLVNYPILNLELKQYRSYRNEVDNSESNVETFFELKFEISRSSNIIFSSGKKLPEKEVRIEITYKTKVLTVDLSITGGLTLKLNKEDKTEILYKSDLQSSDFQDHYKLLNDFINDQYNRFVPFQDVKTEWFILEKIEEFKRSNHFKLALY